MHFLERIEKMKYTEGNTIRQCVHYQKRLGETQLVVLAALWSLKIQLPTHIYLFLQKK